MKGAIIPLTDVFLLKIVKTNQNNTQKQCIRPFQTNLRTMQARGVILRPTISTEQKLNASKKQVWRQMRVQ